MTAMQLNSMKLDIIGMVMDTDDEQLLSKVVSCFNLPGEHRRIPGLAYTREERIAGILEAEEDIRAGRVISNEDMEKWINRLR